MVTTILINSFVPVTKANVMFKVTGLHTLFIEGVY